MSLWFLLISTESLRNTEKFWLLKSNGAVAEIAYYCCCCCWVFLQVASHMSENTRKQVETEKERLIEARRVATTEKELYVRVTLK